MPRRLVIAHLSDLHLSRFGERVTATNLLKGRLPRPGVLTRVEWETVEKVDGWRIQRWLRLSRKVVAGGSLGLRLVDPAGVRHDRALIPPGPNQTQRIDAAITEMRQLARVRAKAALPLLCCNEVSAEERDELIRLDPKNTNLRYMQALDEVRRLSPDVVAITGDITDDGQGYELLTFTLKDYIDAGRLVAVAGNHDLSAVPPGTRHNMPLHQKAAQWGVFRSAARLAPEKHGASVTAIDDVFFLGLNSSVIPSKIPFSGRGKVGHKQLTVAAHLIANDHASRARICLLHHHVAHLRLGPIARADPGQFAMKLSDAKEVVELLSANGFAAVLNGHRHHGYHVRQGLLPHVVSSPSTTWGCRNSGARYFWVVEVVDDKVRVERRSIETSDG